MDVHLMQVYSFSENTLFIMYKVCNMLKLFVSSHIIKIGILCSARYS